MNEQMLKQIGKRIQNRRKQLGYTQEKLAEMMNVSIQMISNLERGNKSIRIDNLIRLCKILGVSTDYILTGQDSLQNPSSFSNRLAMLSDSQRDMIEVLVQHCLSHQA